MGPGQFDTYAECQVVANKLAMDDIPAYCIKSQPVDIEKEMSKMVNMLKTFQKEMDKQ